MPNLDGTGPTGTGPLTGRGRGQGRGQGFGRGMGRGTARKGAGGTDVCTCPKCGYQETHKRGIPCTETKCPKCGTPLRGTFCI